MSEKVTAGVDLDALERRGSRLHEIWVTLDHAELAALIAELRAARAVVSYARHTADCAVENDPGYHGKPICDCGFDRLTGERQ